jgi:hypothetical protein
MLNACGKRSPAGSMNPVSGGAPSRNRFLTTQEPAMAIQWDNTWTQARRHTVNDAMARIERMLTRAYFSIRAANRDAAQRATYVAHFNNASMTNLAAVTNVIRLMHSRVTSAGEIINMSLIPDLAAFHAAGAGNLPAGARMQDVEAFVLERGVLPNHPLTVYIGPSFFTGDVYLPNAQNQRTGTGTILHELSHGVGNTLDHAYTYQPEYRRISANQRAENADSYRAYCQSFD